MTHDYYRPNAPQVIHEVIDGEAVLVNMGTGTYYSADDVGAEIWAMIEAGAGVPTIVEIIEAKYQGASEEIEAGVRQWVAELQEEGLIVVANAPNGDAVPMPDLSAASDLAKPRFAPPVLHRYTDMEELLLLDPIHEVDEMGWPNPAPGTGQDGR